MKRLAFFLGVILLLLTGAAAAGWMARGPLVAWGLERALADRGQALTFTVTDVSSQRILISDLKGEGFSAQRLEALYTLPGLIGGRLDDLRVTGLKAVIPLEGGGKGTLPDLPALPPIHLSDTELLFETPGGPITLELEGRILNPQPGVLSLRLMTEVRSAQGAFSGPLDAEVIGLEPRYIDLDLSSDDLRIDDASLGPAALRIQVSENSGVLRIFLEGEETKGRIEASLGDIAQLAGFSATASLSLRPASALWAFTGPQPLSGSADISMNLTHPEAAELLGMAKALTELAPPEVLNRLRQGGARGALAITLRDFEGTGSPRPLSGKASADLSQSGLVVSLVFADAGDRTHLNLQGTVTGDAEGLTAQGTFAGAGDLRDPVFRRLAPSALTGSFEVSGKFEGPLPQAVPRGPGAALALIPQSSLTAKASGVAWAGFFSEGAFDLLLSVEPRLSGIAVQASPSSSGSFKPGPGIAALAPYLLEDARVELAPRGGPFSLELAAKEAALTIDSEGNLAASVGDALATLSGETAFTWTEDSAFSLAAPDIKVQASALPLPNALLEAADFEGRLQLEAGGIDLSGALTARGSASFSGGYAVPSASLDTAVSLTGAPGSLRLTLPEGASVSFEDAVTGPAGVITLQGPILVAEGAASLVEGAVGFNAAASLPAIRAALGEEVLLQEGGSLIASLTDSALRIGLDLPAASLPGQDTAIAGMSLSLDLDSAALPALSAHGAGPMAQLGIKSLRHPQIAPLSIALEAAGTQEGAAIRGGITLADGQARLPLAASWQREQALFRGSLEIPSLFFAEGGLQPKDISPLLDKIRKVSGSAQGRIDFSAGRAAPQVSGRIEFSDLSFLREEVRIRGLSGPVVFSDLLGPRSDGPQELTLAEVDPVFPIRDIVARFTVEPSTPQSGPLVVLERITGSTAFGPLIIPEGRLLPLDEQGSLTLSFPSLDLAQLTQSLAVDGLTASGKLSGSLPLAIEDGVVKIDRGSLEDTETGAIRYNSPAARQALAGGGESVTLMLDALEDFRYQDFAITLDKPSADELTLGFSLEGSNPGVLDGYPFRFNINLSTNPRSLLEALRLGSDIGKLLLERQGTFPSSQP